MSHSENTTERGHENNGTLADVTQRGESLTDTYYQSALSAVLFYVYIILSVWIILANGVTLVTFSRTRSLRKRHNFIIISLSVMDLFTGVTPLLRQAVNVATGSMEPFTTCMIAMVLQITPAYSSLLHLFTIALERYIAITRPFMYDVTVTSSRLLWTIPFNIGISCFLSLIAFAWPPDQFRGKCLSVLWFPVAYNVIFIILPISAMLILLIGFYSRILVIARAQERAIGIETSRFSNVEPSQAGNDVTESSRTYREESRATRMFIMICGAALVCYVPWLLGNLLLMVASDNIFVAYYYYLSLVLLYANSGINFVIYVAINRAFRAGIKTSLCKSCDGGSTSINNALAGPGVSNISAIPSRSTRPRATET